MKSKAHGKLLSILSIVFSLFAPLATEFYLWLMDFLRGPICTLEQEKFARMYECWDLRGISDFPAPFVLAAFSLVGVVLAVVAVRGKKKYSMAALVSVLVPILYFLFRIVIG